MRRLLVVPLAALLAGCGDPTVPGRSGVYSFADSTFGPDTTVDLFHWPHDRLPVRFWADPRSNMALLVARAVAIWE